LGIRKVANHQGLQKKLFRIQLIITTERSPGGSEAEGDEKGKRSQEYFNGISGAFSGSEKNTLNIEDAKDERGPKPLALSSLRTQKTGSTKLPGKGPENNGAARR